jgi:hypothetical protein
MASCACLCQERGCSSCCYCNRSFNEQMAPQLSPSDPLRERAEKLVGMIRALDGCVGGYEESIDALVAFVQSERQQAAAEAYERAAEVCDAAEKAKWELREVLSAAEIGRRVRALPVTGGAT